MKFTKKIIRLVFIIMMFIMFFNFKVLATTGTVNTETLRLRKEKSTSSTILELISQDEKIKILEDAGDWYKVEYKNIVGYVSKQYVSKDKTVSNKNTSSETPQTTNTDQNDEPTQNTSENNLNSTNNTEENISEESQNEESYIALTDTYITNSNTKVFVLPLITSKTISEIKINVECEMITTVGNWAYIQNNLVSGWILVSKINEKSEVVQNNYQSKTAYVSGTIANFRESPNLDGKLIETLNQNTQITIIGEQNGWYKVNYNGKTGFIINYLVSNNKTQVTSRGTTERKIEKTPIIETESVTSTKATVEQQSTSNSGVTGADIVAYAKTFLGYKYVYGTAGPNTFDCSGFTSYVYKHFGYRISRSSSTQRNDGVEVAKANLQPGDILIFLNTGKTAIGHVGIYIGDDQFIHASSSKTGVIISKLSGGSYPSRYVTARRIIN